MKTKAEQLRELRNKILHNGRPPIQIGCEFYHKKTKGMVYKHWRKDVFVDSEQPLYLDSMNKIKRIPVNIDIYQEIEILGKPTSWGDVLRMLSYKQEYDIKFGSCEELIIKKFNGSDLLELNLTQKPENQNKEVLEKLLKLIK